MILSTTDTRPTRQAPTQWSAHESPRDHRSNAATCFVPQDASNRDPDGSGGMSIRRSGAGYTRRRQTNVRFQYSTDTAGHLERDIAVDRASLVETLTRNPKNRCLNICCVADYSSPQNLRNTRHRNQHGGQRASGQGFRTSNSQPARDQLSNTAGNVRSWNRRLLSIPRRVDQLLTLIRRRRTLPRESLRVTNILHGRDNREDKSNSHKRVGGPDKERRETTRQE